MCFQSDSSRRVNTLPVLLVAYTREIGYDSADRIKTFTHVVTATSAAAPDRNQAFQYDALGRLTSYSLGTTSWAIAYDANGNRTATALNGASTRSYTIEASSNRLRTVTSPLATYTYDATGNVIALGMAQANYDLSGRWASMAAGGGTLTGTINVMGQRVRKYTNVGSGSVSLFVYDQQGQLLGECDHTGAAIREYIWLGNTPVAMFTPDGPGNPPNIFFVETDHIDTPRVVVDRNKAVRWIWMAEPFGSGAPEDNPNSLGALTQPLRFPGQYFDQETGTHYNYFRDYDPWAGRYLQSDPIGLAGGLNTYGYVDGSPISYTDPDGLTKRGGGPVRPMYPPIGPAAIPSTQGHHSGPMFLGFPRNQDLTPLAKPVHQSLHRDLNNFLRNQTNEFGQHMRPQSNNSGSDIQRNFSRDQRFDAMREFYNRYGEHYPQAARDFFRQFPDQSFCGR